MTDKIKLEVNHSKHQGGKQGDKKEAPVQDTKNVEGKGKAATQVAPAPGKNYNTNAKDQKPVNGKSAVQASTQQPADKKAEANGKQQPTTKKQEDMKKTDSKNADPKNAGVKKQYPADPKAKGKTLEPIKEMGKPVLNQIEHSKRRISKNLEELLSYYKEMAVLDFENHGHNPEKEEKIREFLLHFKQEKLYRRKRRKQSISALQEKHEQKEKNSSARLQKKRQYAQKAIMNRLEALKKHSEYRTLYYEQRLAAYKEVKGRKPKFEELEYQANQKLKFEEYELKHKLNLLSQKFVPMDEEEIEQHIEHYEQVIQDRRDEKYAYRLEYQKSIDEENEFLKYVWRGDCHRINYFYRKHREMEKLKAKEKLERMKKYREIVRYKHKPETSRNEEHNKSVESDDAKSEKVGRKVLRYKFVKGVAQGEVSYVLPIKKSKEEEQQLGRIYLEYIRQLPKKKKSADSNSEDEKRATNATDPKKPRKQPIERYYREVNPLYSGRRSYRLEKDNSPYRLNNIFSKMKNLDEQLHKYERLLKHQNLPSIVDYHDRQQNINERLFKSVEHKINLLNHMVSI